MPKRSKVTSVERREWLHSSEMGSSVEELAKGSERSPRTVKEHIQKAQLERDFQAVRQSQLQTASQLHQQDMFAVIDQVRKIVSTPMEHWSKFDNLDRLWLNPSSQNRRPIVLIHGNRLTPEQGSFDFDPVKTDSSFEVRFQPDQSSPHNVYATWLDSPLWKALTEHRRKGKVWENVKLWVQLISELVEALKSLAVAIKIRVEQTFEMPLRETSDGDKPRLTPGMVKQIRLHLFSNAVGFEVFDPLVDLELAHGQLRTGDGIYLIEHMDKRIGLDKGEIMLNSVISDIEGSTEWRESLAASRKLKRKGDEINDDLERISLLHYLPGSCNICTALGSG